MAESFKVAPYGPVAWVWTLSFVGGAIFFGARALLALSEGRQPEFFDIGASVVLLVLLVYAWLRSVRGYAVDGGDVVISRAGPGRVSIAVADIEAAEAGADLGSFINPTFLSVGGVFGWAGKVKVRKPTDVNSLDAQAYGTNPGKSLLLTLKSGSLIVLTPTDPRAMETALQVAGVSRPAAPGRAGSSSSRRTAKSGKRR